MSPDKCLAPIGRRISCDGPATDDADGMQVHAFGNEDRMQLRQGDVLVPNDPRMTREKAHSPADATPGHQLVDLLPAVDLAMVEHIDDEGHDKDAPPADDIVVEMERIAFGGGGASKSVKTRPAHITSLLKRPSAAIWLPPATHPKQAILKKPASIGSRLPKTPASSSKMLLLGCGCCRGSPMGCFSCRDPNVTGGRFHK